MKKYFIPLFAMLLIAPLSAQEISNVTFTGGGDGDTVVVELQSPITPKTFELKDPQRTVVDFNGGVWRGGPRQQESGSGRIKLVRWAQNTYSPDNFRIVLETEKKLRKEISYEDGGKKVVITFREEGYSSPARDTVKTVKDTGPTIDRRVADKVPAAMPLERASDEPAAPVEPEIKKLPEEASPYSEEIEHSDSLNIPSFSGMRSFSIVVNGKKIKLGRPVFVKGNLMVPAKSLFALCGFEASKEKKKKGLLFTLEGEAKARVIPGSGTMTVNGREKPLAAPAAIKKGQLYVPLVSVIKWIGYAAYWDDVKKTLYTSPRINKAAWQETDGRKGLLLESAKMVTYYDAEPDRRPLLFILNIPNRIVDVPERKIMVNEEGIRYIKLFQDKCNAKIVAYLEGKQAYEVRLKDRQLMLYFPPAIVSAEATDEAGSIKLSLHSTKAVKFDVKRLSDPERLIIDIPGAVYKAYNLIEIGRGGVQRMRASQFRTDPLSARVVLDLVKESDYRTEISEDGKTFSIKVREQRVAAEKAVKDKALIGKVIVVDPGHGGSDPGCFGYSGDRVKEKDVNLAVSLKLAKLLSYAGAIVQLTREEDMAVSLQERTDFANNNKADVLVSMHHNSTDRPETRGTETYYFHPGSKLLARLVHKNLLSGLRRNDRGLGKVKFYVVNHAKMAAVLVEPVYLNDREEEALALDPVFQQKVAESVFNGIKEYFEILGNVG